MSLEPRSEPSEPLRIFQYWHEKAPPRYVEELCATFRDCNPEMRHLRFDERAADEFIVEHFGPREAAAFRACAVPAMQADYFRYCAVHALGGVYVDVDSRCMKPLTGLLAGTQGQLFEQPHGGIVNGLFMFRAPGHPVLDLALELATANIERRISQNVWGATGPAIFFFMVKLQRLGSIDAFLEFARERSLGMDPLGWKVWDPKFSCEVVGDYDRVAAALEGVRISPLESAYAWMTAKVDTPYKQTEAHYARWRQTIYR